MEILSAEADKTKRDISPREVKKSNETIKWLTTNNYIDELKTAEVLLKRIDAVLAEKNEVYAKNRKNKELSEKFEENESLISYLSDLKKDDLKDIKVGDVPVLDFWLSFDMSVENAERIKQNNRLKELWFDSVINDKEKSEMLISVTLDKLQNENELIKSVRNAYKDIIENDKTITEKQKEILSNQQESILFFKVISHKLTPKDMLKMEVNVLNTIDQVGIERETILNNAKENIFKPVADQTALTSDNAEDIENTEYITTLLVSAKQSVNYNHKREIDIALKEFMQAKLSGDIDLLNKSWKDSVVLAFEYFETEVLDDITNKNIELLNSINEKVSEKDSSKIKNLTSDKNLSIEQREFIARYKNDKNFRTMLNNPNIDINTIIEDLVFFESSNKNLISQYKISDDKLNINKVMSDKFKQINDENKDIKVQTDRLLEKMGQIKSSVDNFSDNFNFYSKDMLNIQTNEFQQFVMANDYLSSIANNTEVIKRYSCAITRTKLVELGKDKYYKDIISEITDLLPDDEQLSLKDFMAKVEELAKHEKNIKRRNAIIKAGIAVTTTAALATGAYYFGPSVISHMASKLPAAQAGLAVNETIKTTNIAKKLGNSHLISFMARDISQIQIEINRVETEIENCKRSIAQYPAKSYYGQRLQTLYKKLENLQKELQDALSKNK